VDRESLALIRACQRVLGDPHEAEDVAQEAFVIAFRSLAAWRGEGSFGAWLGRIGVRLALRRAARRKDVAWIPAVEPERVGAASASGDVAAAATSRALGSLAVERRGTVDPAALVLRADDAAALRTAVARLDEPYREVVALRFFGELSLAEIAAEADRPVPTIKTQLRRGLIRLRSMLGEAGA
jgi:RNA polymerase sigma-70 factor (ECF subfamily)